MKITRLSSLGQLEFQNKDIQKIDLQEIGERKSFRDCDWMKKFSYRLILTGFVRVLEKGYWSWEVLEIC